MALKIALLFNGERSDTTGGYFKQALEKTQHSIDHYWTKDAGKINADYDLYFRIDHGDYKDDLPDDLRPQVFLAIDTHLKKPFKKIAQQSRHYDLVLCAQKDGMRALRRRGTLAEWLPLACNPEIHQKLDVPKIYDIGFVGTDGKKGLRRILLQKLRKQYPKSFLGTAPYTEMSRIYSASKIGFNCSKNKDINMRIFEIMSCGTLLITNRIIGSGFEELFEDGKHLIVYKNVRHLFRLIGYYLTHEKEREEIAKNGHQLAIEAHTYEIRTAKMLDLIKGNLAKSYPQLNNL